MDPIIYINRQTGKQEVEQVYGGSALQLLYGDDWISKIFGSALIHGLVKYSFFSSLYGFWQKQRLSKQKIAPFITQFKMDSSEFLKPVSDFNSFNDFFIRELKTGARPVVSNVHTAILPADARYLCFQNIQQVDGFFVKGQKFNLTELLESEKLAQRYANGSMVMARLCPTDYHRFHFPCDCTPGPTRLINGWLYSVNPIALKKNINIFSQNKRSICELDTDHFGKVLFIEIGATNVGSICQTYTPGKHYPKGAEKGYFSFGGSSLILLFEPGKIQLDADLLAYRYIEVRGLMGQSLGKAIVA